MVNRLMRNLVGILFWAVALGGLVILNLVVMLANYLACKTSFELLGFEKRPLASDEVVGCFFGAFFHDATLAHFYALAVAVTVGVSLLFLFNLGFQTADFVGERRDYLNADDQENARAAVRLIIWNSVMIMMFLSFLSVAAVWDIQLFKFRSIAGAGQIEDPEQATQLMDWTVQLKENSELWAWRLTEIGAWGYLAVTILACLGLEFSFRKTREY